MALEKIEHVRLLGLPVTWQLLIVFVMQLYTDCPVVAQIHVHGESLKDYLVATVVPEPIALSQIAAEVDCAFDPASPTQLESAVENPVVVNAVLVALTTQVRATGEVKGCARFFLSSGWT